MTDIRKKYSIESNGLFIAAPEWQKPTLKAFWKQPLPLKFRLNTLIRSFGQDCVRQEIIDGIDEYYQEVCSLLNRIVEQTSNDKLAIEFRKRVQEEWELFNLRIDLATSYRYCYETFYSALSDLPKSLRTIYLESDLVRLLVTKGYKSTALSLLKYSRICFLEDRLSCCLGENLKPKFKKTKFYQKVLFTLFGPYLCD